MGLRKRLLSWLGHSKKTKAACKLPLPALRDYRKCQVEPLEDRKLLALDATVGVVYYEDATGEDEAGDILSITFKEGVAGTQLASLSIDTDKLGDGLTIGDVFFDTTPGGLGAFKAFGLQVLDKTGIDSVQINVADGGTLMTFQFVGFDPGEVLRITLDVDEQGFLGPNAVAEGNEFEGSILKATFKAPTYKDATIQDIFLDAYDSKFAGSGLNLPNDNYTPPLTIPGPIRTAGALGKTPQVPLPIELSGYVYEDRQLDKLKNSNDPAISGVKLELFKWDGAAYVTTGRTTTTNADGFYRFDALLPGRFRVVETQPNGYFSVASNPGTISALTKGISVSPDILSDIDLVGGQKSEQNNFGEAKPATLSGHVYHDVNNDGHMDTGEQRLKDATIRVFYLPDTGPAPVATIVKTNADGFWEVTGLRPGKYRIEEVTPTGYLDGLDSPGNAGGSAVNPGDAMNGITLISAQNGINYDFGEILPSLIRGRVHADRDGDCVVDADEPLLGGVIIQLLNAQGQVITSTLTNTQGEYEFGNLAPGTYSVRETQPVGYFQAGQKVGTKGGQAAEDLLSGIVLTSGSQALNYDFCENEPAAIAGRVYVDANENCLLDDGEELLSGVTVFLLDAAGNQTGAFTTTNAQGEYRFDGLKPGVYGVSEAQPAGFFDGCETPGDHGGTADQTSDRITGANLKPNSKAQKYDFGELRPAAVQGRVFVDRDGDCVEDTGERSLANVVVNLLDAQGRVIATTQTNADGLYSFGNLKPGTYSVREEQPAGLFHGGQTAGSTGGNASVADNITGMVLKSGVTSLNNNFCELEPGAIRGRVHVDNDDDCLQDPGERSLANVNVHLLNAAGERIRSTKTNANGEYSFDNLAPGTYGVEEEQPAGLFDGKEKPGSTGGQSSANDRLTNIQIKSGEISIENNFCEVEPGLIRGRVHVDTDNDCVQDPGERSLANVTVHLLNAAGERIRTTKTDANGEYVFDNLAPGTYGVEEEQPAGLFDGGDKPGSTGGTVAANDKIVGIQVGAAKASVENNFCELEPAQLGGIVFVDPNQDCVIDAGELRLSGVEITLLDKAGNVVAKTVTDAQGQYRFTGLAPGEYTVKEAQPAGYFHGGQLVGDAGGAVADNDVVSSIKLGSGQAALGYNFCEVPPAKISGYVYQDGPVIQVERGKTVDISKLRDGRRTADDTPLAGVTLRLTDLSGRLLTDTLGSAGETVTDSKGYYEFNNLPPDFYGVIQVQPSGYIDSLDHEGSTGGTALNGQSLSAFSVSDPSNAIARIQVQPGNNSVENNFSEVRIQENDPPPPFFPPQDRPPPPSLPPNRSPAGGIPQPSQFYPVVVRVPEHILFGGGSVTVREYTWHLSVIDAGFPRGDKEGQELADIDAEDQLVRTRWPADTMTNAQWTLAKRDGTVIRELIFGEYGGIPVTGDFNGDGTTEVGVFVHGEWFIDLNGNGVWDESDLWAKLGDIGDLPVTGDWDGDGKTDIGIFGPEWQGDEQALRREPGLPDLENTVRNRKKNVPPQPHEATLGVRSMQRTATGNTRHDVIDHVFAYGTRGDIPITGDWNGDGIDNIGIFNQGAWVMDTDGDGRTTPRDQGATFGQAGDLPVIGDFDGDGLDEIGVFRDGVWIIDSNHNHRLDAHDRRVTLGSKGDLPITGDWDGDGIDELGLYQLGGPTQDDEFTAELPTETSR